MIWVNSWDIIPISRFTRKKDVGPIFLLVSDLVLLLESPEIETKAFVPQTG